MYPRELRYRLPRACWLQRPRQILAVTGGHEHHLRIKPYTAPAVASPGELAARQ
jgi:hypothetical protein